MGGKVLRQGLNIALDVLDAVLVFTKLLVVEKEVLKMSIKTADDSGALREGSKVDLAQLRIELLELLHLSGQLLDLTREGEIPDVVGIFACEADIRGRVWVRCRRHITIRTQIVDHLRDIRSVKTAQTQTILMPLSLAPAAIYLVHVRAVTGTAGTGSVNNDLGCWRCLGGTGDTNDFIF